MSTNPHHLGRGESGLSLVKRDRTRLLKTSYCFEHIRGQSGQACPRLVCMILLRIFQSTARMLSSSDPGSSGYVSSSRCLGTRRTLQRRAMRIECLQRNLFWTEQPHVGAQRSTEWLGGARRDRTDDLMLAKHALSQLSYGPSWRTDLMRWWAWEDSNLRPHAYQARALTN